MSKISDSNVPELSGLVSKVGTSKPHDSEKCSPNCNKIMAHYHDLRQSHIALLVVQSKENRIKYPVAVSPHHGSCFVYSFMGQIAIDDPFPQFDHENRPFLQESSPFSYD